MNTSLSYLPGPSRLQLLAALLLANCTASLKEGHSSKPTNPASALVQRHDAVAAATEAALNAPAPAGCTLPVYNLAKLKPERARRLDSVVVAQLVRHAPRLKPLLAGYSRTHDLFSLDTLACQGFSVVAWLHRHENCCEKLYYLTFSDRDRRLIDVKEVASGGATGSWRAESVLRKRPGNRLRATTTAQKAAAPPEPRSEGSLQAYAHTDVVVKDYALTLGGRISTTLVDSTRHLEKYK